MDDLVSLVRDAVKEHGDRPALEVSGSVLSYDELWTSAGRLASMLDKRAGSPERVGLYAARSIAAYVGYLAALRIGATVVPLNPSFPAPRNRTVVRTAGIAALLADREVPREVAGPLPIVQADEPDGGRAPELDRIPGEFAYLLFTSGSTGTPKGVPIAQDNVVPYIGRAIDRYGLGPGARMSQNFELTFDPSVFDIFSCFGSGATLVVPSSRDLLMPVPYVVRQRITHWFSVPSAISFARRANMLKPAVMPGLLQSLFIGEQLTIAQADAWFAAAPHSAINNVYGPTELTIHCTEYRLPARRELWPETSNGTVPIGDPLPGLEQIILDGEGHVADSGEIYFRGRQRFRGYIDKRHDLGRFFGISAGTVWPYTGTRPLTDELWYRTGDRVRRENGLTVHVGRLDRQVKVRGYRIELGDVECAVRSVSGVIDASLVYADSSGELHCFYTGQAQEDNDIRQALGLILPEYMIPAAYHHCQHLPTNASGKIDYAQLARAVS
jgi:amino acid adenylation domain-containing protein